MNVNIVLYDDFETMDAFGPAQVFGMLPDYFHINYLSVRGGILNSRQGLKIWTEILIPEEVEDILVIPGGKGIEKFLQLETNGLALIKESVEEADRCLMVGNGSRLLAQTGLLYHRKIVDYQFDENWHYMDTAGVSRLPDIKWMADGKYYSSSCTAASIDMALSVIADSVDIDAAEQVAAQLGYKWDYYSEDGIIM